MILVLAGAIVAMTQVTTPWQEDERNMNNKIINKGIDKLSEPFKDSLSQYQRGRQSTLERTWDDIQIQVKIAITFVTDNIMLRH